MARCSSTHKSPSVVAATAGAAAEPEVEDSGLTLLWRNHTNMNHVFRLVKPVYDTDTYIFKVHVFTKQTKYE